MGWSTKAENCVFDDVGRLASRKGSKRRNSTVVTNTPTIRAVHEYVDASGNTLNIFAADNKIYKDVGGTMTDISGAITTPTGDDWQFSNFNGWCLGYQSGHIPILLDTTSGTFVDADDFGGVGTKTVFNGTAVLSAFGRAWTILNNTLYYSDLLIHNFTGGSSGSFDLAKYWPGGMDEAVALAEFNKNIIVFGKHSIIIYENADDVANMVVLDSIEGIGCPYRDSVSVVGDDLVFASNSGVRSLKRTIIQGDNPIGDISQHVRDDLLAKLDLETAVQVKGTYNEREGFYLLSLPTAGTVYYFTNQFPNTDGTWRATTWDKSITAIMVALDNTMYIADEAGYLSVYTGYRDNVTSAGTGGNTYTMDWEGVWNNFGDEVSNHLKILKNASLLAAGTPGGTVNFKWALEYVDTFSNITMGFTGSAPPTWGGNFTWGGAYTYTTGGEFERVRSPIGSAGQVIKIGMTTTIDNFSFALQRIDLLAKIGRIGI